MLLLLQVPCSPSLTPTRQGHIQAGTSRRVDLSGSTPSPHAGPISAQWRWDRVCINYISERPSVLQIARSTRGRAFLSPSLRSFFPDPWPSSPEAWSAKHESARWWLDIDPLFCSLPVRLGTELVSAGTKAEFLIALLTHRGTQGGTYRLDSGWPQMRSLNGFPEENIADSSFDSGSSLTVSVGLFLPTEVRVLHKSWEGRQQNKP
ncbi:hypothetical protein B0H14DRAFT_2585585 [Mycena olivaceomarginata]|nr:hypothetical protein B0H14DRAFT_2585585 [Mycena olivaceomarginata]